MTITLRPLTSVMLQLKYILYVLFVLSFQITSMMSAWYDTALHIDVLTQNTNTQINLFTGKPDQFVSAVIIT